MAAYKHETSRCQESKLFPGVVFYLRKMTEGRRLELRNRIAEPNRRILEIIKEQTQIEKEPEETRNSSRWLELQDEYDGLTLEKVNPEWILWGVKKLEGLEVDGQPVGVEEWKQWPSALFAEILDEVKSEAALNGSERKNSELPTTSGGQEAVGPSLSIV